MKLLFLFFFIIYSFSLPIKIIAQNKKCVLKGIVTTTNEKGEKKVLPNVGVILKESKKSFTESDKEGAYFLEMKSGIYTVVFSLNAYKTLSVPNILMVSDSTLHLDVALEEDIKELKSVEIVASRQTTNEVADVLTLRKSDNN